MKKEFKHIENYVSIYRSDSHEERFRDLIFLLESFAESKGYELVCEDEGMRVGYYIVKRRLTLLQRIIKFFLL